MEVMELFAYPGKDFEQVHACLLKKAVDSLPQCLSLHISLCAFAIVRRYVVCSHVPSLGWLVLQ